MKLIEILVRELSNPSIGGWPSDTGSIEQGASGRLFDPEKPSRPYLFDERTFEAAEDFQDASVTREEYEAALAASKEMLVNKPVEWDGLGLPPVSYLNSVLNYDEKSGEFTWKPRLESDFSTKCQFVSWSNRFAGKKAGTVVSKKKKSYLKININGRNYYAHRIAWAILSGNWPEDEIDHVNGNSLDNSKDNLRQVTRKENCRNVSLMPNSASGYCGVNWHEPSGKWRARVKVDGKENYLGLFDDPQEAAIRIKAIRDSIGFHKNHGEPLRPIPTEAQRKRSDICDKIYGAMTNAERKDNRSDMAEAVYDAIAAGSIPGVKLEAPDA